MKYVVLARDKQDGYICESFGCFKKKSNAKARMMQLPTGEYYDDIEYVIEEVDPTGSFANDECEDEEV